MSRINVFDQDTLEYLKAAGISDRLLLRVRHIAEECERLRERIENQTPVVMVMPLVDARRMADTLYHALGGNGDLTDDVRRACSEAVARVGDV